MPDHTPGPIEQEIIQEQRTHAFAGDFSLIIRSIARHLDEQAATQEDLGNRLATVARKVEYLHKVVVVTDAGS